MAEVVPAPSSLLQAAEDISQRTRDLFGADYSSLTAPGLDFTSDISTSYKRRLEYSDVLQLPPKLAEAQAKAAARGPKRPKFQNAGNQMALVKASGESSSSQAKGKGAGSTPTSLVRRPNMQQQRPEWHAPWKLMRVVSGHLGWIRALSVEPNNQYFASGAGDRTIKIWHVTFPIPARTHANSFQGSR